MTTPLEQRPAGPGLVGRDSEKSRLTTFIQMAAGRGGSLLLLGEAGVGKTALLDFAGSAAVSAGMLQLRADGVEFETDVSFAGLNQLLMPLVKDLGQLSAHHRMALTAALGWGGGSVADRLVVANATLALLQYSAAANPLLLIMDDLPWIDRASTFVLGFVARRLVGTTIGLLAAQREADEGLFGATGMPILQVGPLTDETALQLVEDRFPQLAPQVSARLVADAGGIPLALLELPEQLSPAQRSAHETLPMMLPLSRHLQMVFASRVAELPAITRQLLLEAALDGTGDLRVARRADPVAEADHLGPAERARLVAVDYRTQRLVFIHPLIRSAVVGLATSGERRAAHRALAVLFADDADAQARHLAQATTEPDEDVAQRLEDAAYRVLRRGDGVAAVAALIRAADLSPTGAGRARRLGEAAYMGADAIGAIEDVAGLLERARLAGPELGGSLPAAVAATYVLLSEGKVDSAHRLLVGAIEASPPRRDHLMDEALYTLLLVCFFGGRAQLWDAFGAAMAQRGDGASSMLSISATTLADPARSNPEILSRLDTEIAALGRETDPNEIYRLAMASLWVDRLDDCRAPLLHAVRDTADGAAPIPAIRALLIVAIGDFQAGRWDDCVRSADEGLALMQDHAFGMLRWSGWHALALVAAGRGEQSRLLELQERMRQWSAPRGMELHGDYLAHLTGSAAIGRGDYEDAFVAFSSISPVGSFAPYRPFALWVVLDLVESAVRTGRHLEATAHVAAAQAAGVAAISSRLALHCAAANALVAADADAVALFERALAASDTGRWPFDRARVELAYGEYLRRAKAMVSARVHLSAALLVFRGLGAGPWVDRAEAELLATGRTRHTAAAESGLTPQESEIAMLAATGLSNRQIGERMFLSPRTIGAHLYRIFPKLRITSRAGLRDALSALAGDGT